MHTTIMHVSDDLIDLLPPGDRHTDFVYTFTGNPAIKHLIEALGIPHTEVGQIEINDIPIGFKYKVQNGDHIQIWGVNNANILNITPETDKEPRFILDNHLGKLAAYLRMLGFDTLYQNNYQDPELAIIASKQDRILLTRDRRLLMRSTINQGYLLRSQHPQQQLMEVIKRFRLIGKSKPFYRCLRCNGCIIPISKETIMDKILPLTRLYYEEFYICQSCNQIYWKGSHYEHMLKNLRNMEV